MGKEDDGRELKEKDGESRQCCTVACVGFLFSQVFKSLELYLK